MIVLRKEKEKFLLLFSFAFVGFRKGLSTEMSHIHGKEWPIKAGKITEVDWIYPEQNMAVFNIIALIFREQHFVNARPFH